MAAPRKKSEPSALTWMDVRPDEYDALLAEKVTKLRERKDDLAGLGSLERFVVKRFMQPWSYRHDASYTTSSQSSKRTLNYVYQQLR